MKLNKLEFDNPIILSPMAGEGDFAFRAICRKHGADFSYSEMISINALLFDSVKTKQMLYTLPEENHCGVQFFGDDEEKFAKVVKLPELQKFDVIDLNFGCPAPKIFGQNSGSALLADPMKISKIVSACVKNTVKPVTCKIRIGLTNDELIGVKIAKICEDAGASLITVHGRTREQNYSGNVNYDEIAHIKQSVKIPVIGNGDVKDFESYQRMLKTGVDGVSLARAALGRPWIFNELKNVKEKINPYDIIKEHVDLMRTQFDEAWLAKYFRKHFLWYLKNYENATELKLEVVKTQDINEMLEKLKKFFKNANKN